MFRQILPLAVAAVAATALIASAAAQDAGPGAGSGTMLRSLPVFVALDADGSGDLSAAEIKAAATRLRTLDKDASGSLETPELLPPPGTFRRSSGQRNPAATAARLMEFDRDGQRTRLERIADASA